MSKSLSHEEAVNRAKKYNLQLVDKYIDKETKIRFRCYCGKIFSSRPGHVFSGGTRSCGCYHKNDVAKRTRLDLVGKRFGKWLVLERVNNCEINIKNKDSRWYCQCDCGKIKIVKSSNLIQNSSKSCGCSRINPSITQEERIMRHGLKECKEWRIQVYKRDKHTCQICNQIGGKLNAHHMDSWHWCVAGRFDVNNGVTLCKKCHKQFHTTYGIKNNTKEQFQHFKDSKLCKK